MLKVPLNVYPYFLQYTWIFSILFCYFWGGGGPAACGILVPQTRIQTRPPGSESAESRPLDQGIPLLHFFKC